ncbi:hypothetical protein IWX90DRAFT_446393 [Phyllosticta citrichinensis]|uniref:Uncharacterized protein n=1 Tax=Phyllosticta citrichinensis TaxID=1130410 RepID=A0ABR1XF63_9PEZI
MADDCSPAACWGLFHHSPVLSYPTRKFVRHPQALDLPDLSTLLSISFVTPWPSMRYFDYYPLALDLPIHNLLYLIPTLDFPISDLLTCHIVLLHTFYHSACHPLPLYTFCGLHLLSLPPLYPFLFHCFSPYYVSFQFFVRLRLRVSQGENQKVEEVQFFEKEYQQRGYARFLRHGPWDDEGFTDMSQKSSNCMRDGEAVMRILNPSLIGVLPLRHLLGRISRALLNLEAVLHY